MQGPKNVVNGMTISTHKRDFVEDVLESKNEENVHPLDSFKKLIKPVLISKAFEENSNYKLEPYSAPNKPDLSDKKSPNEPIRNINSVGGTSTPSPSHLKSEIRFFNDSLLIMSVLLEAFQNLIEETKLPSSKPFLSVLRSRF